MPSRSRAAVCTTSMRPHPVTQGALPSRIQPPADRRAVKIGAPGRRRPAKATPERHSPRQSLPSHSLRRAVDGELVTAKTALWCWAQTKAEVRQAAGEDLGHLRAGEAVRVQATRLDRAEQPVEAGGSYGVQAFGRHDGARIGLERAREQHGLRHVLRPRDDVVPAGHFHRRYCRRISRSSWRRCAPQRARQEVAAATRLVAQRQTALRRANGSSRYGR